MDEHPRGHAARPCHDEVSVRRQITRGLPSSREKGRGVVEHQVSVASRAVKACYAVGVHLGVSEGGQK